MSSLKRSSARCATQLYVVGGGTVTRAGEACQVHPPRDSGQLDGPPALSVRLRWQAAGGRQSAEGAPHLTDGLLHLGHPVREVAVVELPTIERRHGRQRRHGDRVLGHSGGRPRPRPGSGRYGGRTTSRSGARPVSPNSRRLERWVTSTAIPAAQKSSSNWVAFLTAMPRPAASEVAETSGVAARMSTAAAARECRRRPATARRAASQARSIATSRSSPSSASSSQRAQERRHPGVALPRRVGAQRAVAGQRHRRAQQALASPRTAPGPRGSAGGRRHRRGRRHRCCPSPPSQACSPVAAASSGVAPDAAAARTCSARCTSPSWSKSGASQPLVQVERVAGGGEDGAAVDDAERAVHAEAQPLEHGGEVPGIDRLSVDRGLAAHGLEPDPVKKGRAQGVRTERLVKPGEGTSGMDRAPATAVSRTDGGVRRMLSMAGPRWCRASVPGSRAVTCHAKRRLSSSRETTRAGRRCR